MLFDYAEINEWIRRLNREENFPKYEYRREHAFGSFMQLYGFKNEFEQTRQNGSNELKWSSGTRPKWSRCGSVGSGGQGVQLFDRYYGGSRSYEHYETRDFVRKHVCNVPTHPVLHG